MEHARQLGTGNGGGLRAWVFGWALLSALASTGCTAEPRSGAFIGSLNQTFSGWFPAANHALSIQVYNHGEFKWTTIGHATTGPDAAYTDPCDVSWFPFSATATLPKLDFSRWWTPIFGGTPLFTIRARVFASSFGGALPLYSFSTSSDACIQAQTSGCGGDIAQACGRADGEIFLLCNSTAICSPP